MCALRGGILHCHGLYIKVLILTSVFDIICSFCYILPVLPVKAYIAEGHKTIHVDNLMPCAHDINMPFDLVR